MGRWIRMLIRGRGEGVRAVVRVAVIQSLVLDCLTVMETEMEGITCEFEEFCAFRLFRDINQDKGGSTSKHCTAYRTHTHIQSQTYVLVL